jgi:predicted O-methyltransferase YrrM
MIEKFTRMNEQVYDYLLEHQPSENCALAELRAHTDSLADAKMQSTTEQGHLLALLVRLICARHVLDIGTFTGTSALAIALALPEDGLLTTFDLDGRWLDVGRRAWKRAGVAEKIEVRLGPASTTLLDIEETKGTDCFDLVFIDADKTGYDSYYESSLRLVRPGGLLVLDNTLRRGRVAIEADVEPDTLALRAINTKIAADERVDRVLLPIASGMTLARRR